MILFLRLLLAHLIADFLLQPTSWVKHKNEKKIKSSRLFFHVLIVTGLSCLLVIDQLRWEIPVFIFVFHYLIDLGKIYWKPRYLNELACFMLDQLLHVLLLLGITIFVGELPAGTLTRWPLALTDFNTLIYLIGYFVLIWPSGILINLATQKWQTQIAEADEPNLMNAGKWIGILERVLVLTFVLLGQFQAIGFLIAAKSILRFSVKNETNARILSEYVLVGTLISFTLAILVGLAVQVLTS